MDLSTRSTPNRWPRSASKMQENSSLKIECESKSNRISAKEAKVSLFKMWPIVLLLIGSIALSSHTSLLANANDDQTRAPLNNHLPPHQLPVEPHTSDVQATHSYVERATSHRQQQLELPPVRLNNSADSRKRLDKRQAASQSSDEEPSGPYEPLALALDGSHGSEARHHQVHQPQATSSNPSSSSRGKKTLYACEEKQLQIECQGGETIQLIRANYGRFSIQICNDHGQLDWKVNCMSSSSFDTIERSCQAKQSCQLLASNDIFGDSCPGTPKYLEVHYSCVPAANNSHPRLPAGSTLTHLLGGSNNMRPAQQTPKQQQQQNVIPENNLSPSEIVRPLGVLPGAGAATTTTTAASSAGNQLATSADSRVGTQLPPWVMDFGPPTSPFNANNLATIGTGTGAGASEATTSADLISAQSGANLTSASNAAARCPETVMRQIRWPSTEAGQELQRPCPPHAHSGNPNDPYPAVLLCLARGEWAPRVQAARCQSNWLRNLTVRVEAGDSPLTILGELVHRTRAPAASGLQYGSGSPLVASSQPAVMFGDDIRQIGQIVRRLVEEMGELIQRISDDKQRHGFAKEMVQSLIELLNNLANEHQTDAWLDLATVAGERQRIAGQLMQNVESAAVLLAGAQTMSSQLANLNGGDTSTPLLLAPQDISSLDDQEMTSDDASGAHQQQQQQQQLQRHSFLKVTENVYVAIGSLALRPQAINQTLEVSLPSKVSTLGTKWMDLEQRFTLHLQATSAASPLAVSDNVNGGQSAQEQAAQALKVVFIMVRSLGAQMEPRGPAAAAASDMINTSSNRIIVNSNLVSLSIVADSRSKYNPPKVDLSAPIELVFRHSSGSSPHDYATQRSSSLSASASDWFSGWFGGGGGGSDATAATSALPPLATMSTSRMNNRAARCAFWDPSSSDWLTDGCKLISSNLTHSICACNHLSTFALLAPTGWPLSADGGDGGPAEQHLEHGAGSHLQHDQPNQLHHSQQPRVQLNSVENELLLQTVGKPLYLAKMLDGHLFEAPNYQGNNLAGVASTTSQTANNLRLFIYGSCLASAFLLAVHLAASIYHRAHERRLLSAIPSLAPPPLLVTSNNLMSGMGVGAQAPVATLRQNQSSLRNSANSNNGNNNNLPPFSMITSASSRQVIDDIRPRNQNDNSPTYSSSDYSAALANTKSKLQQGAFGGSLMATTASNRNQSNGRLFQVPSKLVGQLLALQLLVVLLVESQNYTQRYQQQQRSSYQNLYYPPPTTADFRPVENILPTIGVATTCLLLALYYLVASFTCWLAAKLMGLNMRLFKLNCMSSTKAVHGYQLSASSNSSSDGSDKLTQYGAANTNTSTTNTSPNVVATIYGGMRQQQLYGYGNNAAASNGQPMGVSPTSSFDSSAAEQQRIYGGGGPAQLAHLAGNASHLRHLTNSYHQQQQHQRSRTFGKIFGLCSSPTDQTSACSLIWTIENILPIAITALIGWLSMGQSQAINSLTYVTSFGAQLANWPLLLDCGSSSLAIILYYLPVVCFVLVGLALFVLNQKAPRGHKTLRGSDLMASSWARNSMGKVANGPGASIVNSMAGVTSIVNPYGSSTLVAASHQAPNHNNEIGANGGQQQQQVLNKQQEQSSYENPHLTPVANSATGCHWQLDDTKRTRITCSILLALLALHWICWISFFAHCHQMINSRDSNYHLMYVFATSNLLLVLLLIWSQRRILKRVSQLTGLTRCLKSLGCCCCHFIETTCLNNEHVADLSPTCSPVYHHHHHQSITGSQHLGTQQRNRFSNSHHHLRSSSSSKLAVNGGKVSPSSQSLFLISQQQQQQQAAAIQRHYEQQLQQPNYHYGQQHLYQQIASPQQHIYDSTSALNNLGIDNLEQSARFNQMMQQQQQQLNHHQQQGTWHPNLKQQQQHQFNRSMTSLHQNHHNHQHFVQHQDHMLPPVAHQRQPMTLKPLSQHNAINNNHNHHHHLHHSQTQDMLVLDANSALKHHQQQQMVFRHQQEQADGPLVAFSSCGSSASTSSSKPADHFLQSAGADMSNSLLAAGGHQQAAPSSSSSSQSSSANGQSQQQQPTAAAVASIADAYRTSAV